MSDTRFVNRVSLTPGLERDLAEISQNDTNAEIETIKAPVPASTQELAEARAQLDASLPILQQVLKNKHLRFTTPAPVPVFKYPAVVGVAATPAPVKTGKIEFDMAKGDTRVNGPIFSPAVTEERVREIVKEEFIKLIQPFVDIKTGIDQVIEQTGWQGESPIVPVVEADKPQE